MAMTFLEAQRTIAGFGGGPELEFLFALSGTAAPLDLYLRAEAAARGRSAVVRVLPFNTLAQHIIDSASLPSRPEVFLLLPWDFVPELDWRSGLPAVALDFNDLRDRAERTTQLLSRRKGARFLYLPAPIPPALATASACAALHGILESLACSVAARLLPASAFSLDTYLMTGCPVQGRSVGEVAHAVIDAAAAPPAESCKVLVTDLDNVMWHGVIAEEGLDFVHHQPEGLGYPHFLYQTLLKRLAGQGTLLAAVTRNDRATVAPAFASGRMVLDENDFVSIIASYHAKSSQIRTLAEQLNLGLDAFVFVDDNPIEIEEVSRQLPQVHCIPFPSRADALPETLAAIAARFPAVGVTDEDRARTALYRRRLDGMAPSELSGADLTGFLRDLRMELQIVDRTRGDRTRAVQLINKTNQFNLNGRRVTDDEVAAMLAEGGRLYGATLTDRTGTHGEILACIIDRGGVLRSLVMSCRVFQRQVESEFIAWLAAQHGSLRFDFAATPRNEPIQQFLHRLAGSGIEDGVIEIEAAACAALNGTSVMVLRAPEASAGAIA
jgi:FkbH-like protein